MSKSSPDELHLVITLFHVGGIPAKGIISNLYPCLTPTPAAHLPLGRPGALHYLELIESSERQRSAFCCLLLCYKRELRQARVLMSACVLKQSFLSSVKGYISRISVHSGSLLTSGSSFFMAPDECSCSVSKFLRHWQPLIKLRKSCNKETGYVTWVLGWNALSSKL